MLSKSKTKYYSLPVLSKEARRNSNLATNLATVGLFSALAACGGSSSSGGTTNTGNDKDTGGGDNITAINLNAFVAADPIVADITLAGNTRSVPSTRYDATTLYIREGITTEGNLGSLTTGVAGKGTVDYTIDSNATFSFGNVADGNNIATYFAIDSDGTLKLTGKPLNFDYTPTTAAQDGGIFSFEVTASSGTVSAVNTVTVQLGGNYTAPAAGTGTVPHYLSNGDDFFQGGSSTNPLITHDWINAGTGNDILYGGIGQDRLLGGDGDDIIYGGDGSDILHGGDGNDILHSGAGVDQLQGGAGDDILYGGPIFNGGSESFFGNAGADKFVVDNASPDDNGNLAIRDFSRTEKDKIVFENTGGNLAFGTLTVTPNGNNSDITGYGAGPSLTIFGWNNTGDKKLAADDFIFVSGAFADLA